MWVIIMARLPANFQSFLFPNLLRTPNKPTERHLEHLKPLLYSSGGIGDKRLDTSAPPITHLHLGEDLLHTSTYTTNTSIPSTIQTHNRKHSTLRLIKRGLVLASRKERQATRYSGCRGADDSHASRCFPFPHNRTVLAPPSAM